MLSLPVHGQDLLASAVLYRTDDVEIRQAARLFLRVRLAASLVFIDNSPEPLGVARSLADSHPQIHYHRPGTNLGYGSAHNIALRAAAAANSRYSLVMNTDIDYPDGTVERMVEFADRRPTASLIAPRIVHPDGELQHVCRLLPRPSNMFLRRFLPGSRWAARADHDYELRWWDHRSVANLPYFQGSFMLLRTSAAAAIGGFDERFFMYGEDIDLTRRLHAQSETLYFPDVTITHQYRRYSKGSWKGTWIGIVNNARYFNKWGWMFDRERDRINERVMQGLSTSGERRV